MFFFKKIFVINSDPDIPAFLQDFFFKLKFTPSVTNVRCRAFSSSARNLMVDWRASNQTDVCHSVRTPSSVLRTTSVGPLTTARLTETANIEMSAKKTLLEGELVNCQE